MRLLYVVIYVCYWRPVTFNCSKVYFVVNWFLSFSLLVGNGARKWAEQAELTTVRSKSLVSGA